MNERYVKENDLVYWAEYSLTNHRTYEYQVHCGYYLATYKCGKKAIHIVSLEDITSCVVRHLKDDGIFYTKEEAQKKADELNKLENK